MYGSAIRERVRELYASGMQRAEIRRKLGIKSRSTIYNILHEEKRNTEPKNMQSNTQLPDMQPQLLSIEKYVRINIILQNRQEITPEELKEIKESIDILWLCNYSMQRDIEFLQADSVMKSILFNELKSQISNSLQITKMQNDIHQQNIEFKEILSHQNRMQELKEIKELIGNWDGKERME